MMLLKGNRRVYGQGAWRITLLLSALLAVLILGLVFRPAPGRRASPAAAAVDGTDSRAAELARLKMLGHALRLHADEHDGKFPATIADIQWRQTMPGMEWAGLPAAASRFHHPADGKVMDWLYFPGHTENDPPRTILAASPVSLGASGDQRMVVRLDGVADVIPEAAYQQEINEEKLPGTVP